MTTETVYLGEQPIEVYSETHYWTQREEWFYAIGGVDAEWVYTEYPSGHYVGNQVGPFDSWDEALREAERELTEARLAVD